MSDKVSEKGISPLIAAILLIAFTMTVAAILATWAQTFGTKKLKGASEKGEKVIECSALSIQVDSLTWQDNQKVQAILWNRGNKNISNFDFVIYNTTHSTIPHIVKPLNSNQSVMPGDFITLKTSAVQSVQTPDRLKVRVFPEKCSDYNPLWICDYRDGKFIC